MNKQQMLEWIDTADYYQLLKKIRFEKSSSPWVQGEVGIYLMEVYKEVSNDTPQNEKVRASKDLGWDDH